MSFCVHTTHLLCNVYIANYIHEAVTGVLCSLPTGMFFACYHTFACSCAYMCRCGPGINVNLCRKQSSPVATFVFIAGRYLCVICRDLPGNMFVEHSSHPIRFRKVCADIASNNCYSAVSSAFPCHFPYQKFRICVCLFEAGLLHKIIKSALIAQPQFAGIGWNPTHKIATVWNWPQLMATHLNAAT